jgi:hypothetical protein
MERMRFHVAALLLALLVGSASRAECPPPPVDVPRIAELARGWDSMHDALPVESHPESGDIRTPLGTVLDPSCTTGPNAANGPRIVAALERGLARALERADQCFQRLRIVEMRDVISVLRRTRIQCIQGDPNDDTIAMMRRTCRMGTNRARYSAGATHDYQMGVITPPPPLPAPTGPAADEKKEAPSMLTMSPDDLGSYLAHEAMHVLAANSHSWHDSLEGRRWNGCENSVFADRIYFTQAACFPDSFVGQGVREQRLASRCPGLCEGALTTVEASVVEQYRPATRPGDTERPYGPPLAAHPYSRDEASRICTRLREGGY